MARTAKRAIQRRNGAGAGGDDANAGEGGAAVVPSPPLPAYGGVEGFPEDFLDEISDPLLPADANADVDVNVNARGAAALDRPPSATASAGGFDSLDLDLDRDLVGFDGLYTELNLDLQDNIGDCEGGGRPDDAANLGEGAISSLGERAGDGSVSCGCGAGADPPHVGAAGGEFDAGVVAWDDDGDPNPGDDDDDDEGDVIEPIPIDINGDAGARSDGLPALTPEMQRWAKEETAAAAADATRASDADDGSSATDEFSRMPSTADGAIAAALAAGPRPQSAGTQYVIAIHQSTGDRRYFAGGLGEDFDRPGVEECFARGGWKISENKTCRWEGMECYPVTDEIGSCGDAFLAQRQTQRQGQGLMNSSRAGDDGVAAQPASALPDDAPSNKLLLQDQNSRTRANPVAAQPAPVPPEPSDDGLLSRFQAFSLETKPLKFGDSAKAEYRKMPMAPPHLLENSDDTLPRRRYINVYSRCSKSDDGTSSLSWARVPFREGQAVFWFKSRALKRAVVTKVGMTKATKTKATGDYEVLVGGKKAKACHEDLFVRVHMADEGGAECPGWAESNTDSALEIIMAGAARRDQICEDDPSGKGNYEKRSLAPPFFLLNTKPSYDKYVNAYSGDGSREMKEFEVGSKAYWLDGRQLRTVEITEGFHKLRRGYYHVKVLGTSPGKPGPVKVAHRDLFVSAIVDKRSSSSSSCQFWDADYKFGKGATGKTSPGNGKLRDLLLDNIGRYFKAENEPPMNRPKNGGVLYKSDVSREIVDERCNGAGAKFWYEVHADGEDQYWAEEVNVRAIRRKVGQMLRDKKGEYVMLEFFKTMGVPKDMRKAMDSSNKLRLFEQVEGKGTRKVSSALVKLLIFSNCIEDQKIGSSIIGIVDDSQRNVTSSDLADEVGRKAIVSVDNDMRSRIYEKIRNKVNAYVENEPPGNIVIPQFKELLVLLEETNTHAETEPAEVIEVPLLNGL